jgi:hypothetical protein
LAFSASVRNIEKQVSVPSFVGPKDIAFGLVKKGNCSSGRIVQAEVGNPG